MSKHSKLNYRLRRKLVYFYHAPNMTNSVCQRRNTWILLCWNVEQNYCTRVIRSLNPTLLVEKRSIIIKIQKYQMYIRMSLFWYILFSAVFIILRFYKRSQDLKIKILLKIQRKCVLFGENIELRGQMKSLAQMPLLLIELR